MRFFLKAIDVWHIVESGWITLDTIIAKWIALQKQTHVANDKAMNAICSTLSLSKFSRISLKLQMKERNWLNLLNFNVSFQI